MLSSTLSLCAVIEAGDLKGRSTSFKKFGNSKAISWGTKLENDINGIVISNPKLFVKKITSVKTLEYPVKIEGTTYKVKFNTAGFRSFLPDLKDAGCSG